MKVLVNRAKQTETKWKQIKAKGNQGTHMKENESNGNKGDQRNTKGSTTTERETKERKTKVLGGMQRERTRCRRKGTQRIEKEHKGKQKTKGNPWY